ncbi:uncharacterized protein LOC125675068 isoform X4 [Ostrea edulis]|uniref:uncharacterized protein LOC125675068 isoform X4 n=1 Tax=Ostrea edulis TaxID=37623 RepID=UPI0024AF488F|nr:uncharacterized protein LOC125675068 isoform X4 [Ostrea edulis]
MVKKDENLRVFSTAIQEPRSKEYELDPNHAEYLSIRATKSLQNGIEESWNGTVCSFNTTESAPEGYDQTLIIGDDHVDVKHLTTAPIQYPAEDDDLCFGEKPLEVLVEGTYGACMSLETDKEKNVPCKERRPREPTDFWHVTCKRMQKIPCLVLTVLNSQMVIQTGKLAHDVKKILLQETYFICDFLFKTVTGNLSGRMGSWRNIFWMLLFLIMVAATSGVELCSETTVETMRVVKDCPIDKKTWDEREAQMNCSSVVPTQCVELKYHCVVNGFGNANVEVCAQPKYIQPGSCPEFNEKGRKIQNSHHFKPSHPPENAFISTDVYNYRECLHLPSPVTSSTTTIRQTTPPTSLPINEKNDSNPAFYEDKSRDKEASHIGWILGISVPVICLIMTFFICRWCKKYKERKNLAGATDEEQGREDQCTGVLLQDEREGSQLQNGGRNIAENGVENNVENRGRDAAENGLRHTSPVPNRVSSIRGDIRGIVDNVNNGWGWTGQVVSAYQCICWNKVHSTLS